MSRSRKNYSKVGGSYSKLYSDTLKLERKLKYKQIRMRNKNLLNKMDLEGVNVVFPAQKYSNKNGGSSKGYFIIPYNIRKKLNIKGTNELIEKYYKKYLRK